MSSLMVSTSGIRGIIGESLTPELATKVGASFGLLLGKGPVIVGGDTRVSHECINHAVLSGLVSAGTDVIYIGKVPTPTVQQAIRKHNASGGIVVTASHNPIQWNGLKLMNESGSFLSDAQFETFLKHFNGGAIQTVSWDNLGRISDDSSALEAHVDLILDRIDCSAIKDSGLRVLIDPNNGTGALANPLLFDKLGIDYTMINSEPDGRFDHDPEPMEKNLSRIKEALKAGDYDIGFVQDADADRLVILDETGRFIGEDYSLGLCIDYVLNYEMNGTQSRDVVVNLSTSKLINDISEKQGCKTHQTRIGEPNVTAKIKELDAVVGGEGNGGIIYPKIGWGRDSLVGMVLALNYLAKTKKSVSEIVSDYPQYTLLREKFSVQSKDEVQAFLDKVQSTFSNYELNTEDGVKVLFETGWIHVRPSNTEPIARVFIEELSLEKAKALMDTVLSL